MITHVVIGRACEESPDGSHAQVRMEFEGYPDLSVIDKAHELARAAFREGFGHEPARVGAAILPFVTELDRDD